MIQQLKEHRREYVFLIVGLVVIGASFVIVWPNINYQRKLIALLSFFYFIWGVTTHVKSQVLTKKVVVEYMAVSLLAGSLLYMLTL